MSQWYYVQNGQQAGPVSDAQFRAMVSSGQIAPDTLVWQPGMPQWVSATTVGELAPAGASAMPPSSPLPPTMPYGTGQYGGPAMLVDLTGRPMSRIAMASFLLSLAFVMLIPLAWIAGPMILVVTPLFGIGAIVCGGIGMGLTSRHQLRGKGMAIAGLVIGIVQIVMALPIAILLPAVDAARERANRVKCASNLSQMGRAFQMYINDNKGVYPRTIPSTSGRVTYYANGSTPGNPFASGQPVNCVTSSLYLLCRTQDLAPEVLMCPSTADDKDTKAPPVQFVDFTSGKNLSYGYANPFPDVSAALAGYRLASMGAGFAVAADMGCGVSGINDSLTYNPAKPKMSNSNNHNKAGQNVLFGDGHVEWRSTVVTDLDGNIYASGRGTTDMATGVFPDGPDDSVIIPWDDNK